MTEINVHAQSEDKAVEEQGSDTVEELHGLESESQADVKDGESQPVLNSSEVSSPGPTAPNTPAPATDVTSGASGGVSVGSKLKIPRLRKRDIIDVLLVVLIIALALWSLSLSSSNNNLKNQNSSLNNQIAQLNANPQAIIQKQTQELIIKVSKLMNLPTGETPTIANVTNASAAKQQSAFFKNAQNGDKVLMYVKAGEAILYRPSTNKIILVAPLTLNNNNAPAK